MKIKPILIAFCLISSVCLSAQEAERLPQESDYYKIVTLPVPEGVLLEVGGMTTLEDGRVALCTRRGQVWIVENPDMYEGQTPKFTLYAEGLHEPLGLASRDNAIYIAQRGELTKLSDTNGDGRADRYQTIYDWPLSGHYHEYSYGPKFLPDGSMIVTANVAFGDEEWWRGESRVPWRGWTMQITEDGKMTPWATGMRSPCGLGIYDGEFFYTDNQGDWMGSGGLWHVKKGSFTGHPAGLKWASDKDSPIKLSEDQFYAQVDKRQIKKNGRYVKPDNVLNEENPDYLYAVKGNFPEVQLPAVWLPHGVLGISNSEILEDQTAGAFGPFAGQLFIGDQGQSKIMRVALEKVNGVYQGAAFDFRAGFQSGVLRMTWGNDGSLFVGETNRGWGSAGDRTAGLERLIWNGKMPFEMKAVRAKSDGFEIEFTEKVDPELAKDLDSYVGRSYTYKYHPVYGSPTINIDSLQISGVQLGEDGKTVRLKVDNLRQFHVHELSVRGLRSANDSIAVLHPTTYYTLNEIPTGEALAASDWSNFRSSVVRAAQLEKEKKRNAPKAAKKKTASSSNTAKIPTYAEIQPLLNKNTCIACHQVDKKQIGPAYKDIAKRNYSVERIVELIYNPEPGNWPDYSTPMAPMPQVPRVEATKIARWIKSLK